MTSTTDFNGGVLCTASGALAAALTDTGAEDNVEGVTAADAGCDCKEEKNGDP